MAYSPYVPIAIGAINWGTPVNNAFQELDETLQALPQDHSLMYWQFDPATNMVGSTITSGTVSMSKLWVRRATTITNLAVSIATVGVTLTAGQNFLGLYDATGTRLGVTADLTATWGTTGFKQSPLTAPVAVAAGPYWVAVLSNAATTPAFARGSALVASIANPNLTAADGRFTTGPAAQTSLPANIVMASRTLSGNTIWAAMG